MAMGELPGDTAQEVAHAAPKGALLAVSQQRRAHSKGRRVSSAPLDPRSTVRRRWVLLHLRGQAPTEFAFQNARPRSAAAKLLARA